MRRLHVSKRMFTNKQTAPSTGENKFLIKLANSGNSQEQYELGMNYYHGRDGFHKSPDKSRLYLSQAAAQGHPDAEFQLGKMLLSGKHAAKNVAEAFRVMHRSAQKGHVDASAVLGNMLLNGIGTRPDRKSAFEWLKKASVKGNYRAMYDLGAIYSEGILDEGPRGSEKDGEKIVSTQDLHMALRLAEKSGHGDEKGLSKSQRLAGSLHTVSKNIEEGKKWFLKSAVGGDIEGMTGYGQLVLRC